MAQAASLDFRARHCRRNAALKFAGVGIVSPADAVPFVQEGGAPLEGVFVPAKRPPASLAARPIDVAGAFAVASFATNADFRPCCVKTIIGCVVVLLHTGRMTLRAHKIPVLIEPGPMQH